MKYEDVRVGDVFHFPCTKGRRYVVTSKNDDGICVLTNKGIAGSFPPYHWDYFIEGAKLISRNKRVVVTVENDDE